MQIVIPLRGSTGSGGSGANYNDTLDSQYLVYSPRLIAFNIGNAFVDGLDTSQAKRGLASIGARHPQNNSRSSQYSLATVSGVGVLEINTITYSFSSLIQSIDSGRIVTRMMFNPNQFGPSNLVKMDDINNRLDTAYNTTFNIANSATYNRKGYKITSGGNHFIIVSSGTTLESYPCDVNGVVTGTVADTEVIAMPSINVSPGVGFGSASAAAHKICILGVNGISVFVGGIFGFGSGDSVGAFVQSQTAFSGYIYTVNSSGVFIFTTSKIKDINYFNTDTVPIAFSISNGPSANVKYGNYQSSLTGHFVFEGYGQGAELSPPAKYSTSKMRVYMTVDLSNTGTFTYTTVVNNNSNTSTNVAPYFPNTLNEMIVGYDATGTRILFVTAEGTRDIWECTGSAFADTTSDYFGADYKYTPRYRKTLTVLTTVTANNYLNNNKITINNVDVSGTFTSLYQESLRVLEMSGTNQEDDTSAFKGLQIPVTAVIYTATAEELTLEVNGDLVEVKNPVTYSNQINFSNFDHQTNYTTSLTAFTPTIQPTKFNFLLSSQNPNARDVKFGFGVTGGTYAVPVGTNDSSGNATTGRDVGVSGSYIDLTLA